MEKHEAVGIRQSAVETINRWHRELIEREIAEMVFLNLAADALSLPVGDRLAISHFALSASVSPLALAAARERRV